MAASCGDIGFGLEVMLASVVLCVRCVLAELKVGEAREAAQACRLYDMNIESTV